jgi:hypothetical protein
MNKVYQNLFTILGKNCNILLLHALRKLILLGHLFASDPDYYTIARLITIMRHYGYNDMLFCCIDIERCY